MLLPIASFPYRPNACIIQDDKPRFIGVSEILRINADQTVALVETGIGNPHA